ncbi:bifunctional RNase H/acid phosphatase [Aquipuribacter hungaricus]|uniref:Bifunctional RNase H/acid phosphatase n=1 Tax=Aquipuribacter hungaricus TaxID=545624 RepID=A0ABV7WFN1_9MICO
MTGTVRQLVVEADGGSRGNPGPSGFGALVREAGGGLLAEAGERCGLTTNNVAEYSGLLAGLRMAAAVDPSARVEVRMDSKLVVEQMSGRWKIKDRRLAGIAAQASRAFEPSLVRYTWVPRAQNGHADRLANEAMDGRERRVDDVVATLAADAARSTPDDPTDPVGPMDPAPDPLPSRATGAAPSAGTPSAATSSAATSSAATSSTATSSTAVPAGASQGDLGQATTVLLVRHGRTRLTQERRFSGVRGEDAPLTDVGRLDALGAVPFLAQVPVDAVVVSPLLRARQTADVLRERLGWPRAAVDDRWAELAFGEWDALTAAEVAARGDGDLFGRWLGDASVSPPGGESMRDLEARVAAGLADLLEQHRGGTVVVVCHMTPIRSVVRTLLGAGEEALGRLRFAPGSLTTTRFWPDGGAEVDGVGLHVPPDVQTLF